MRDGVNFENAYLGHMASETVITHNVITSGQLPKDMGWADEAFRDSDNVLGVGDDSMWITGSLTRDQFNLLIAQKGYAKLADYLHAKYPGTKFIAAGQKDYAVHTSNGPTGDISVTFSGRNFDCDGDGANNWRGPTGLNVPTLHLGAELRALLRRLVELDHVRHRDHAAGLDVPARRPALRRRPRPGPPAAATSGPPTPAWR